MPILIFEGGLHAPIAVVSLIPHSSPSGSPSPWKNSITSGGQGAAPTFSACSSSIPSACRSRGAAPASIAARSFSNRRGTAKNQVGRTSGK